MRLLVECYDILATTVRQSSFLYQGFLMCIVQQILSNTISYSLSQRYNSLKFQRGKIFCVRIQMFNYTIHLEVWVRVVQKISNLANQKTT